MEAVLPYLTFVSAQTRKHHWVLNKSRYVFQRMFLDIIKMESLSLDDWIT